MASLIPPGYLSAIIPDRHPNFSGCLTAAILSGQHPIFSGCLTAAIPPGYLNHHSTRPTSHFLWMSHNRHSTRIPQSPFHPVDIPFSLDVSQPPFHHDTSATILTSRHPTSTRMSHSRHSIRPTFYILRIFHTWRLPPDGKGGRFNFQLSLQIKMSFKLKHLTVEHSCSELVPSIQNFPASLHGNLAIHTFSSIRFFYWELIVLN